MCTAWHAPYWNTEREEDSGRPHGAAIARPTESLNFSYADHRLGPPPAFYILKLVEPYFLRHIGASMAGDPSTHQYGPILHNSLVESLLLIHYFLHAK